MKRSRFDYTAWGIERPFPWLGLLLALLSGLLIVPVLAWLGFELLDQGLESFVRR